MIRWRAIGISIAGAVAGVLVAQMTTPFADTDVPSQAGFRVVTAIGAAAPSPWPSRRSRPAGARSPTGDRGALPTACAG
ncbi:hypothetical protein ACFO4E_06945 [Nocardiopsis mangrovi]|uniref:Uncharacterized protein n=1 Tax=Nocardiopsis mangrovi TaxID=1179818 RepID=A0ABV9DSA4_9ACTN